MTGKFRIETLFDESFLKLKFSENGSVTVLLLKNYNFCFEKQLFLEHF